MARKSAANSTAGQTKMRKDLAVKIEPPIKLTEEEARVFETIISALPVDCWEAFRVRIAASLARMTVYQEMLFDDLQREGAVVENKRGTPVTNPKQNAMMQATSSIQSLTRTLGLSASQRGISESTTSAKKIAEKEAKSAIDKAKDSGGLLA